MPTFAEIKPHPIFVFDLSKIAQNKNCDSVFKNCAVIATDFGLFLLIWAYFVHVFYLW